MNVIDREQEFVMTAANQRNEALMKGKTSATMMQSK
jgi:hypothetical protein